MSEIGEGSVRTEASIILEEPEEEENILKEERKSVTSNKIDADEIKADENSKMTIQSPEIEKVEKKSIELKKWNKSFDDPEKERIFHFLRGKDLSEILIGRVLKNGISDGFDRLLQALGITNEEIDKFQWTEKFDPTDPAYDSFDDKSIKIHPDESSLSSDNLYLQKNFGYILVRAMKDIVKFKPCDPIDFLGNWLINHKVCEERENRRKELESDLIIQRDSSKSPEIVEEAETMGYNVKEELIQNNYIYEKNEEENDE